MPETTGTVDWIKVGDDFGFTSVASEFLILWWDVLASPPGYARILHAMQVSLLREALLRGRSVRILHDGALVRNVKLL